MKTEHVLLLVFFLLIVLMVRNPKKTTTEITTGEQAFVGVGSGVMAGFFTPPKRGKGG